MLMNSIEYWAMNNPLREFVQRHYEAPRLMRLSKGTADNILEIGCGKGEFLVQICEIGDNRGVGIDPTYVRRCPRSSASSRIPPRETRMNFLALARAMALAENLTIALKTGLVLGMALARVMAGHLAMVGIAPRAVAMGMVIMRAMALVRIDRAQS